MANFVFSAHAEVVIAERGISKAWVEETLKTPDSLHVDLEDPDLSHAIKAIPDFGGRVLRVVFNNKAEPARIVTAYFDRRLKR